MISQGRYTPGVLLLLAILAGCDLTPMPKRPTPQAKPPRGEAPAKKIPDAALRDTGVWEEGGNLIREVVYVPAQPTAFDDVKAEVRMQKMQGVDIDYAWSVNGRKLLSGRGQVLRQTMFNKGDKVQVRITIEKKGKSASRDGKVITIANSPPRILTNPSTLRKLDGFRVRGEDPDGGAVTYRLASAPPGLTIGEQTGVFRYAPAKNAEGGRYEIKVVVVDKEAAESEWSLVVTISGGSESAQGKAKRAKAKAAWEAKRKAKLEGKAPQQDQGKPKDR